MSPGHLRSAGKRRPYMPDSSNIARHLPLMAARQPDAPAIKIPRGRSTDGRIDYSTESHFGHLSQSPSGTPRLAPVSPLTEGMIFSNQDIGLGSGRATRSVFSRGGRLSRILGFVPNGGLVPSPLAGEG